MLDAGDGEKLERFGEYIVARPDPQVIWKRSGSSKLWNGCHMHYYRDKSGGGRWELKKATPKNWTISYKNSKFLIQPTDFKHMGIFPEQSVNWNWVTDRIQSGKKIKVLNLFAYTGGASVACVNAGAKVCHVDAAKGMNNWAKENIRLSGLDQTRIRFIADDVMKFVEREKRRESYYNAVIMDPPSYGRGPNGEMWRIEDKLFDLVKACVDILENPIFFLINSYTTGFSPTVAENLLKYFLHKKFAGTTSSGEIGLEIKSSGLILPCGAYGRWESISTVK